MSNIFGPLGGDQRSESGKLDWNRLKEMMQGFKSGKDMSKMPWAQGQPYPLSGGQPRTFTPSPAPNMPFMPAPQMGGPQTFQPNANLGMGPTPSAPGAPATPGMPPVVSGGFPQTAGPWQMPQRRQPFAPGSPGMPVAPGGRTVAIDPGSVGGMMGRPTSTNFGMGPSISYGRM